MITPVPITDLTGQPTTLLYLKFDEVIKKLFEIIKKLSDVDIVVKLHPSREEHNEDIGKLIREIDPTIPVYHTSPTIIDLLDSSDVLINIQPESFNTSTVLMESFIREKPTMTIFLDSEYHDLEYVKDGSTLVSDGSDLEKNLQDILFNKTIRDNLINNGKIHLQRCLSNHGTSSEYFAEFLSKHI